MTQKTYGKQVTLKAKDVSGMPIAHVKSLLRNRGMDLNRRIKVEVCLTTGNFIYREA